MKKKIGIMIIVSVFTFITFYAAAKDTSSFIEAYRIWCSAIVSVGIFVGIIGWAVKLIVDDES